MILKYLCIILARNGSKRVPKKNVRTLHNKPLIQWTLDFATSVSWFDRVFLSTDIEEIMSWDLDEKIHFPFLRPSELCTDEAASEEAIKHVLQHYKASGYQVENIVVLQPTSPFRTRARFEKARTMFENSNFTKVVGVSPLKPKFDWYLHKRGNRVERSNPHLSAQNADKMPNFYFDGSIYISSTSEFETLGSVTTGKMLGIEPVHAYETIDIDTEDDFQLAGVAAQLWYDRSSKVGQKPHG